MNGSETSDDLRELGVKIATKSGEILLQHLKNHPAGEDPPSIKDVIASAGTWLDKAGKLMDSKPPEEPETDNRPSLADAREAVETAKKESRGKLWPPVNLSP